MHIIQNDMGEFRRQLEKGSIQPAYRTLLSYMSGLRTHFMHKFGDRAVSGFYQGYMDMTYFALIPPSLKRHDLKVAIVFNYNTFRFEAWLAARNRKVQRHYWALFKDNRWTAYRVVAPAAGSDSIIECDLANDFDLSNPAPLTSQIENATAAFIADIESVLKKAGDSSTRSPSTAPRSL
jgi:hypothetical protein